MKKNHRCEESLKAKVSINYTYPYEWDFLNKNEKEDWRMFNYIYNSEYDCFTKNIVGVIKYCPFCGKKLEIE